MLQVIGLKIRFRKGMLYLSQVIPLYDYMLVAEGLTKQYILYKATRGIF